jgi:imidazole glycerol-phosphate synthase subunit HisH
MITIINYGIGNLGSVANMFKRLNVECEITNRIEQILSAKKLLLPGVGSFDQAMKCLNEGGFREALDQKALIERVPILGICLGMQLLTRKSEEGQLPGLGWIAADTIKFTKTSLKVPHMGWNIVQPTTPSPLTKDLPQESRFYFVHSYRVHVDNEHNSILKCTYGVTFDAAIQKDNIYGAQFHPEKSHKYGMQLLKNFAEI